MQLVRLRNLTGVEQSVFLNNKRVVLGPRAEKDFVPEVAGAFLNLCDGLVEEIREAPEVGAVITDTPDTGLVWLANMTGNPDAPKVVQRKKHLPRGEWEWTNVPNPLAEPIDVVRYHDGGQTEYETQDGLLADNNAKLPVIVPRYGRKPLPRNVAEWMLNRDANARWISPFHTGRIKVSRPKSAFEPDLTWKLDDMRCYLHMIDNSAELGPSEEQVLEDAARRNEDLDDALREAKTLCMKRLHFRLADPQYRLISKAEYEGYRHAFEKPTAPATRSSPSASATA